MNIVAELLQGCYLCLHLLCTPWSLSLIHICAYCAGQFLFDNNDPYKVLDRLDKPFFVPEAPFEKSGQYKDGTVFIEGLAYYKKKLYLYYGCADSRIAVAVCDNVKNLKVK